MSSRPLPDYHKSRFEIPDVFRKWKSRYDFDSEELENLQAQQLDPLFTTVLDLTTARPPNNPLELVVSGRAFNIKGITDATVYDFAANTGIETVATQVLVNFWVNKKGGDSNFLPLKNGQGYKGDFMRLFLFWPAQDGLSARINIFKFDDIPWMSGDNST